MCEHLHIQSFQGDRFMNLPEACTLMQVFISNINQNTPVTPHFIASQWRMLWWWSLILEAISTESEIVQSQKSSVVLERLFSDDG